MYLEIVTLLIPEFTKCLKSFSLSEIFSSGHFLQATDIKLTLGTRANVRKSASFIDVDTSPKIHFSFKGREKKGHLRDINKSLAPLSYGLSHIVFPPQPPLRRTQSVSTADVASKQDVKKRRYQPDKP